MAGPGPVRLVGFDPRRRRRFIAVVAVTSAGQLFARLVMLMGDAGLSGPVGRGLATAEAHRWQRTARGWVVEVYPLTAGDFAARSA
jgi:hypothetical protein